MRWHVGTCRARKPQGFCGSDEQRGDDGRLVIGEAAEAGRGQAKTSLVCHAVTEERDASIAI